MTMVGPSRLLLAAVGALLAVGVSPAHGRWRTQQATLQPGWNAVYLQVDPMPAEPAAVFAGLPVTSVWMWNPTHSTMQYVTDPEDLVPQQPDWLHWLADGSGQGFLTNLYAIRGGVPYLVYLGGDQARTLDVTGTPVTRPTRWLADSYNLVGFQVDPGNRPTFAAHLAASPALAAGPMYRLAGERWERVASPATERIEPGAGYWIYCKGSTAYPGPLRADFEGHAVDFGSTLTEQVLRIENHSGATRTVEVALRPSAPAPAGAPAVAGDVALSYWNGDATVLDYVALGSPLRLTIPSGKDKTVRFAVRRAAMGQGGGRFQSLLEVRDGVGTRLHVPVTAAGIGGDGGQPRGARSAPSTAVRVGLWVGTARVTAVSHPPSGPAPQPTPSEMPIRLIVHVDRSGVARLLNEVTLLWRKGTEKSDPTTPGVSIPDEPGRFVLVTRDDLLADPRLSGAVTSGGAEVGRRLSSAAFGTTASAEGAPVVFGGSAFGAPGAAVTSEPIVLGFDHPLNPFKHRYHPDHDNRDRDFEPLGEGHESYTIRRTITLAFEVEEPNDLGDRDPSFRLKVPGWGDTRIGGGYREVIDGLHGRGPLTVAGTFRLHHASPVAVLNDVE